MAHFAELDENNVVKQVIVVNNNELLDESGKEVEQKGIDFCVAHYGGTWIQTSYNSNFRKNYAGVFFVYDEEKDAFIPPKSFNSWVLNEATCRWEAPVPRPNDGKDYEWDEDSVSWKELDTNG